MQQLLFSCLTYLLAFNINISLISFVITFKFNLHRYLAILGPSFCWICFGDVSILFRCPHPAEGMDLSCLGCAFIFIIRLLLLFWLLSYIFCVQNKVYIIVLFLISTSVLLHDSKYLSGKLMAPF